MRTLSLLSLALLVACGSEATPEPVAAPKEAPVVEEAAPSKHEETRTQAKALFGTPPSEAANEAEPVTDARVKLGLALYNDTRLSQDRDLSCNSCHDLAAYGVDAGPTSIGHKGQKGGRNSPTVYYAAFHATQFWDGRAKDVEEQAKGPVLNPMEMALKDDAEIEARLAEEPSYAAAFAECFEGDKPMTADNMAIAIAAFERRLVTPGPLDAFIAGDDAAMTDAQLVGMKTFIDTGCTTCHSGPIVGGQMFQKLGLVKPYETADLGRQEVTGNEADKHVFKVPSLRNVDKTGPYFHDGSIATLDEAVKLMASHQLGKELDDQQVGEIVAFLGSLTGEINQDYISN
ncbi:MAG: c-type cytochrome [Rhodobacterales bacterium]|nr:c-type cytochrome [Rhodobacterales bacterium]